MTSPDIPDDSNFENIFTAQAIDLGRVFDIVDATQDPEVVAGLVMSFVTLHQLERQKIEDDLLVVCYDRDWQRLRAAGFTGPIVDDPRAQTSLPDLPFLLQLIPGTLFQPREKIIERSLTYREEEKTQNGDWALSCYETVAECAGVKAADFLSGIGGPPLRRTMTVLTALHYWQE